jgi:hypothetical protein
VIEFFEQCSKVFGQRLIFKKIIGLMVVFYQTIKKIWATPKKVSICSKIFSSRSKNIRTLIVATKSGRPKIFGHQT